VAIAHFTVPCETPHIIESKSFKLYLGSFTNTPFADAAQVLARLRADLNEALWRGAPAMQSGVGVKILLPEMFDREPIHELDGLSLDRLDIECTRYTPAPDLLRANVADQPVTEVLTSNLLKSNCLVTGQPDWGSVQIVYSGPQIDQEGLLQYLVSFRNHNEFHEQCVERIFMDIRARCQPTRLAVYARYTRRGGLDINPFRTSYPQALPKNVRTARQ
jgi:7-cyano-7-deazaguanine reductase